MSNEDVAVLVRAIMEESEKRSRGTWTKILSSVGGALLVVAALHQAFIMPSIREETRIIVNEKVSSLREEREKDTGREYTALKERLDRIEGKLDRVIEKK